MRNSEINEIKYETKRKVNDEIKDILEKLDVNLTTLKLRYIFYDKSHNFQKERELKISVKEKTNEIIRVKKAENNKDKLLKEFFKINKWFRI